MNKNLKISLILTSGIVFLMSLLWFIAWFIAWLYEPSLMDRMGDGRPYPYPNTSLKKDIIEVLMRIDLPVPTYFHILRFRLQNSEAARMETLRVLTHKGAKANLFCKYEDLVKISNFRAFRFEYSEGNSATSFGKYIGLGINVHSDNLYLYETIMYSCIVLPDGYISAGYGQFHSDSKRSKAGDHSIRELYKKHGDGRLELVVLAKEFTPNPP